MRIAVDLVGYQLVWFAAVIGAGHGSAWPGVGAAALFVGWHLATAASRPHALRMVAAALAVGLLFDGSLARAGWIHYAASWPPALAALGAPAWILALWASFALTLTRSFAPLQRRPVLATVLGAMGGPLAFYGAARGWGAVSVAEPAMRAWIALGAGWALALPLLAWLARLPAPATATRTAPAGMLR